MKRIFTLLSFFFFVFLFLSPKNFLTNNVAHAITAPSQLGATATCTQDPSTGKNTVSSITFEWYLEKNTDNNVNVYFQKTGDPSETSVSNSAGGTVYLTQSNLPYNQTYDWHIHIADQNVCIIDCEKTTNGPQAASKDCSAAQTCTPTNTCQSLNYDCGNYTDSCGITTSCGTCDSCDPTTHKCSTSNDNYDCTNRAPECSDLTKYPVALCRDTGTSNQCNLGDTALNCSMRKCTGGLSGTCTYSCAYNINQIPGVGDCVVCVSGTWNGTQCTAAPTTGVKVDCGAEACAMGQGCVGTPPTTTSAGGDNVQIGSGGKVPVINPGCGTGQTPTLDCIFPLITNIVYWALIFAGVLAVFLVIYAGIRLITSGGDPKTVLASRNILTFAIAGLVLILLSFFIINFISYVTNVNCIKFMGFNNCPTG